LHAAWPRWHSAYAQAKAHSHPQASGRKLNTGTSFTPSARRISIGCPLSSSASTPHPLSPPHQDPGAPRPALLLAQRIRRVAGLLLRARLPTHTHMHRWQTRAPRKDPAHQHKRTYIYIYYYNILFFFVKYTLYVREDRLQVPCSPQHSCAWSSKNPTHKSVGFFAVDVVEAILIFLKKKRAFEKPMDVFSL